MSRTALGTVRERPPESRSPARVQVGQNTWMSHLGTCCQAGSMAGATDRYICKMHLRVTYVPGALRLGVIHGSSSTSGSITQSSIALHGLNGRRIPGEDHRDVSASMARGRDNNPSERAPRRARTTADGPADRCDERDLVRTFLHRLSFAERGGDACMERGQQLGRRPARRRPSLLTCTRRCQSSGTHAVNGNIPRRNPCMQGVHSVQVHQM
jgi:hypothetical protein